ncbi:MAG TPA: pitrilysin family protein [Vicinamibacterales bacterium]|nr:pitrilysin family protein [Vicinamibacterales bacterium]
MTVDRSRLPVPGRTPPFHFPAIERSTLPNGLRVWTVGHASIPVATVMLLVRRGAADDPQGKEGLAAITADMLDEGTGALSSIEIHEALARVGAQLDSDIGPDATVLTVTVLSRFMKPAVSLLGEIVVRPSMRDEDFQRVRQLRLHRLVQLRDMPGAVADRAFMRLLYGQHPYGHTPLGNEASLSSLTVDDVRTFHAANVRPSDATLVVAGDCAHADVAAVAGEVFAAWEGASTSPAPVAPPLPGPPRLNIIPRPGAPQSELRIGHVSVARSTPDYHALVAANMVLGGQFVSRINLNLREEKGFTYGARTSFDFRRLPGPFSLQVSVQTAATAEAIKESMAEISGIRDSRPVSADELALGVAALTRGYARNFETAEQLARAVTQLAMYDLPDTYFDEFVARVEHVTTADVTRVTQQYLDPARLTTLIVGDYGAVSRDLPKLDLGVPSILAADTF